MEPGQYELPSIQRLTKLATEADAFVIITPEYHNGMSGALKNALDFLGIDHFKKKPTAILSVQGGVVGGFNALNQLRLILRSLHANTLTEQVIVNARSFSDQQQLVDDAAIQQVANIVKEFVAETNERLQLR